MLSTGCPHRRVDRHCFLDTTSIAAAIQTGYAVARVDDAVFRAKTDRIAPVFQHEVRESPHAVSVGVLQVRTHLSTVVFNRTRACVTRTRARSYRFFDNSPHSLSTAATTSYGKLYYCALNQCFLGSAPFRIATSASRRSPVTSTSRLHSCDSSVVLRHQDRSKRRLERRCSPTLPRASVGTVSGRPMRTTFAARKTRAT